MAHSRRDFLSSTALPGYDEYRERAQRRRLATRCAVTGLWMGAGSFLALLLYGAAWLLSAGANLAAGEVTARVTGNTLQTVP